MSSRAISAGLFIRCVLSAVILLLCTALATKPGHAQQAPLSPEYSAGFAFFKYAKTQPNFEQWVKSSRRYADATPRERVGMLRLEPKLLENRFDNYVPSENPFELSVTARIFVPGKKRAEEIIARDGMVQIPIKLTGYEDGSFPLQLADMWITLVPTNLKEMTTLKLNQEQYTDFKKKITGSSLTSGTETMLRITFVPTGADTKKPLHMNGFDLWMLQVKITEVELWDTRTSRMTWVIEDGSSGKSAGKTQDLFNLYE